MKERKIGQMYKSRASTDGAGVSLRRLFWRPDTLNIDPFLLLDLFDTTNSEDYIKGFPLHPHRGIETLTYLISGEIKHKDTLGNLDTIYKGESQWMSAGSGIMHEEMPQMSDQMLGFQLWINIDSAKKMSHPAYVALRSEDIPTYSDDSCTVKVIAGTFEGTAQTRMPSGHSVEVYDINIKKGSKLPVKVNAEHSAFLVPLQGKIKVAGTILEDKTAATLVDGDVVTIEAVDGDARVGFFAGRPFDQPIAWRGPIVMNTEEELETAFKELDEGTFIKENHIEFD